MSSPANRRIFTAYPALLWICACPMHVVPPGMPIGGEAMKAAVVGLGYVGTVTAACLASQGHDVWGVDVDAAKVDEIRSGRSPVAGPGLDALVLHAVGPRTLDPAPSCANALDPDDL